MQMMYITASIIAFFMSNASNSSCYSYKPINILQLITFTINNDLQNIKYKKTKLFTYKNVTNINTKTYEINKIKQSI